MGVLTRAQLDAIRVQLESPDSGIVTGGIPNATWNLAIQAIEDWFETSARAEISAAMNTATSPTVLTAAQKKAVGLYWLFSKFGRGG